MLKVTVMLEKLRPNGTLSEFAQKFTQSAEKLGVNVDSLKSLKEIDRRFNSISKRVS